MDRTVHLELASATSPFLRRIENRTMEHGLGVWDILRLSQPRRIKIDRSVRVTCCHSYGGDIEEQPGLYHSHRNDGDNRRKGYGLAGKADSLTNFALSGLKGFGLGISVYKDQITWRQIYRSPNPLMQFFRRAWKPSEVRPTRLYCTIRQVLVQ